VVQGEGLEPLKERPFAELTPRENEILCLLAEGQSNKVIARNLGISDGTVKLHVKAILRKLGVHSRVEAAVMAVEQGLRDNAKEPVSRAAE
jgi:two-component system, NarL family, nitrate/nitrite response regulator NarL